MLADLIKAGKLPPVEQRISDEPLVVPPYEEIGQYGGIWRMAWKGPADYHAYGRLIYEPVIRWPRNPKDSLQPGLAKKWEVSSDGKTVTLYFRKGLKWSDGVPWTVDDIIFWWEGIETNKAVTANPHAEWVVNGKPMTLEKVDDLTIRLKFDGPNGLVPQILAYKGNQWPMSFERFGFFAPAHYLKQFMPKYNTAMTDYKQFEAKADDLNSERPAMTAWTISQYKAGDAKMIASRNPYYWKVDPQGQQLPYIDQLQYTLVENNDAIAAQALSCAIDMQYRNMDLKNFPLFNENAKKCDYRVLRWSSSYATMVGLWPNQSYPDDPVLRQIFQDKNFRIGLSLAINRAKINSVSYLEQGVINAEPVVPDSASYVPEIGQLNTQYDPKQAGDYLDKAGLKLGPDGKTRMRPDGKPLEITVETERTGADLDAVQLVLADWNAVGVKATIKTETRELFNTRVFGNQIQVMVWQTGKGVEPWPDPANIVPIDNRSYIAPGFGTYYNSGGAQGEKPVGKIADGLQLWTQLKAATDPAKQLDLEKQIIRMNTEEVWTITTVGMVTVPLIVKNNFRNVPDKYSDDTTVWSPGALDPSHFFFKK
jgi:peptide/nickel transport system substrate-binding protein